LAIRDYPPDNLQRIPGPKAIQYYLEQDTSLGLTRRLSTRSIYEILKANGRMAKRMPTVKEPFPLPAPLQVWEIDFKDLSRVPVLDTPKAQHRLECLNVVDEGTSLVLDFRLSPNFTAETTLEAMLSVFSAHGLPAGIRLDRDVRFVGSWTTNDFPSAFIRCLYCLGVEPLVCPPRRPQDKPFVERYNGTYERECLQRQRLDSPTHAQQATQAFVNHYNTERPNQARSCGNRPPSVAFPILPTLRTLPEWIDPDAWLSQLAGRTYVRRLNQNGTLQIDRVRYYIKKALAGQHVTVNIDTATGEFIVYHRNVALKRLPILGLQRHLMPLAEYLPFMVGQARSEWARYTAQRVTLRRIA
jgi:transposase InsO family protein